jgi:protein-S-isoprenylcysteine O-methyltransferase Ste14
MRRQDSMAAIWARAIVYLGIIAGGWLGVLPAIALTLEYKRPRVRLRSATWVAFGTLCGVMAAPLGLVAGFHLITRGRGTPLPLDPPRALVTSGPYRVVRNPQAIAMLLAVAGEVAAIRSRFLWLMLPLTVIYLELLVGPWEDRQLTATFGEAYLAYKRRVHKWLPSCPRENRAWFVRISSGRASRRHAGSGR